MADLDKMDRTWLCSVVFMDIAAYSSQSVELQMKWKQRFNGYLAETIREVPESERVILDTGDGAAVCFLGAPEAAMFAALQLCRAFVVDEQERKPGLRVRLGINLGPVKLIKDINGALNAIGDGINAGQRIMSFAAANEILVSQSFYEVVSRLSDDYKLLFQLKGVERDKHVREHTVYHLVQPGSAKTPGRDRSAPQNRSILWMGRGVALVVLAAVCAWRFYGSGVTAAPIVRDRPSAPDPVSAAQVTEPPARATAAKITPVEKTPAAPVPAQPEPAPPSNDAKAAYEAASRLADRDDPAEAAKLFSQAIKASPDYLDAYVGRAEARRKLVRYELSLEDCNRIIAIQAGDARGFNCRGLTRELLKQYEPAMTDLTEAIRLNPNMAMAFANRGTVYSDLQQYERALQDYNEAIRLRPRNFLFHQKRANAYSSLKQYDRAIHDYTEAIRLQPNDLCAYALRASAEDASGDAAAAAADRSHVREMRKKK